MADKIQADSKGLYTNLTISFIVSGFLSANIACCMKYTDMSFALKCEYFYCKKSFIVPLKVFHGCNEIRMYLE